MKTALIRITLLSILIFLLISGQSDAATERRLALVIGNSNYTSSPLKNPANDARDMADTLKNLGFHVILKTNASKREMGKAIDDFGKQMKGKDVGLFYYAGHGLQVNGVNYLIPVGTKINEETDVEYEAIDAGRVLATMHNAKSRVNIVILDACRDNPYARSFRTATRGLAIIAKAPMGTIVSYSTSPGDVARDGKGRNSPYTSSLLQYMKEPGLTIEQVFKNTRQKLTKETSGKQIPWELSSLQGDFYFKAGSAKTSASRDEEVISPGQQPDTERVETPSQSNDTGSFADLKIKMGERRQKENELLKDFEDAKQMEVDSSNMDEKIHIWKQFLAAIPQERTSKGDEAQKYASKRIENLERWKVLGKTPPKEIKNDGRFIAYDDGTVLDSKTNLMWAANDNGSGIDWQNAKIYCETYGGGGYNDWRMPTEGELAGLYDPGKSQHQGCNPGYTEGNNIIHVITDLIHLSCGYPRASETRGSQASGFDFHVGKPDWTSQSGRGLYDRALPVRSGK
jgi:hypothetical protein